MARLEFFRFPVLFSLFLGFALPHLSYGNPLTFQVGQEIRKILTRPDHPGHLMLDREMLLNQEILPGFYAERDHMPAWVTDLGVSRRGLELLDVLRDAASEGLCPEDYHLRYIEPLIQLERDSRHYGVLYHPVFMADLDLLLTDAFLLYASQLTEGRVDPTAVHQGWRARPRKTDLKAALRSALEGRGPVEVLKSLVPPHRGYVLLREALARYRRISAWGGWPIIPAGPVLRSGARDTRLPLLRTRLFLSGDLEGALDWAGDYFDASTETALTRFQVRHGLDGDGVLGPRTRKELNVPVEERIRQIELNLERWRWLPKSLGDRYVVVNIADFTLMVVERGQAIMSMPVVVGTSYRKTPVFSGRMTYLEFAPYWGVPPTILREDKLPKIQANPGFLRSGHFEIVPWDGSPGGEIDPGSINWNKVTAQNFPGLLRQKPGPWNPLGKVKFMFPNEFDVYLHDTPDRYLFARDRRSFSSGCIRIERPADLAQYLLEGENGWDCDRIIEAMDADSPLLVPLPSPIPVHVLYWTAWVDEGGALQFRKDFYLRDADLDLALQGAAPDFGAAGTSRLAGAGRF